MEEQAMRFGLFEYRFYYVPQEKKVCVVTYLGKLCLKEYTRYYGKELLEQIISDEFFNVTRPIYIKALSNFPTKE